MKIIYSIFLTSCMSMTSFAQLYNFDATGKKTKLAAEKIEISLDKTGTEKNFAPILATALGSLVGIGVNAVQAHLTAKQESYATTYSSSVSDKDLIVDNAHLNLKKITITRKTKESNNNEFTPVSTVTLGLEQDGAMFRMRPEIIKFDKSKARIRKAGKTGKTIDVNITIKVDAIWREFDNDRVTLESGTLGESSITLAGISPGKEINIADYKEYTDWFKVIPPAPEKAAAETRGRGWYSITITVKEVNPYGVTSKKRAEFFKENSDGITTLLQGLIPEGDKKAKD